jgi:pilus assembly protein Flp/PilA
MDLATRWFVETQNRMFEVRSGERGATAVEYGIMVALIAAVIIVAVRTLGEKTNNALNSVNSGLS